MVWNGFKDAAVPFFLAFGVTVGGGLLGGFGQWLAGAPVVDPGLVAYRIRIWAVAVAIGGTLTAFEQFEQHLTARALGEAAKTAWFLVAAYGGAHLGYRAVTWWSRGGI